jgi:hypothetical protein
LNRALIITALACATVLGACGRHAVPTGRMRAEGGGDPAARARAATWVQTARFEDADPAIDCKPDCREQERGFDYARAKRIEQPGDCDLARVQAHASEDFIEGCRAYGQYIEAAARGQ